MLESGVISPIAHASNVNLAKKKRAAWFCTDGRDYFDSYPLPRELMTCWTVCQGSSYLIDPHIRMQIEMNKQWTVLRRLTTRDGNLSP
jgi:hypothetical protein